MKRFNYETGEYDIESHPFCNGYDYENQAWILNGRYVRCGHPESMDCGCYGRAHEGETVKTERALGEQRK